MRNKVETTDEEADRQQEKPLMIIIEEDSLKQKINIKPHTTLQTLEFCHNFLVLHVSCFSYTDFHVTICTLCKTKTKRLKLSKSQTGSDVNVQLVS
jgi:hypothetical protein